MTWVLLDLESVPKDAIERLEGRVRFYADHNVDGAIVEVLRFIKYDVETARDIGAEGQPDDFHFKRAYNSKRAVTIVIQTLICHLVRPSSNSSASLLFFGPLGGWRYLGGRIPKYYPMVEFPWIAFRVFSVRVCLQLFVAGFSFLKE
jgi:hypothetical protein